jgi:hypothetical protein
MARADGASRSSSASLPAVRSMTTPFVIFVSLVFKTILPMFKNPNVYGFLTLRLFKMPCKHWVLTGLRPLHPKSPSPPISESVGNSREDYSFRGIDASSPIMMPDPVGQAPEGRFRQAESALPTQAALLVQLPACR